MRAIIYETKEGFESNTPTAKLENVRKCRTQGNTIILLFDYIEDERVFEDLYLVDLES